MQCALMAHTIFAFSISSDLGTQAVAAARNKTLIRAPDGAITTDGMNYLGAQAW